MPQPSFIDSWIEPWRNTLFISRSHVKPNPIRQHPATGLADPMVCTDSHGAGAVQWRSWRVVDVGGRRGSTGALWIQAEPRMDVGWYVMMNDNDDGWGLVKQVGLEWRSWEIDGNHGVCLISRIAGAMVMLVITIWSGSLATLAFEISYSSKLLYFFPTTKSHKASHTNFPVHPSAFEDLDLDWIQGFYWNIPISQTVETRGQCGCSPTFFGDGIPPGTAFWLAFGDSATIPKKSATLWTLVSRSICVGRSTGVRLCSATGNNGTQ